MPPVLSRASSNGFTFYLISSGTFSSGFTTWPPCSVKLHQCVYNMPPTVSETSSGWFTACPLCSVNSYKVAPALSKVLRWAYKRDCVIKRPEPDIDGPDDCVIRH